MNSRKTFDTGPILSREHVEYALCTSSRQRTKTSILATSHRGSLVVHTARGTETDSMNLRYTSVNTCRHIRLHIGKKIVEKNIFLKTNFTKRSMKFHKPHSSMHCCRLLNGVLQVVGTHADPL
jgi:hypothetical protein